MKKEEMMCCEINCKKTPKYHIQNTEIGAKYDDYTHSCEEHLAEMVDTFKVCEVWQLQ